MDSMDSPTAHILYFKGGVGAEHAYWRTSWNALTLEVGKSPPAVRWRAQLPTVFYSDRRFASSLRRRAVAGPPNVRFSTTGANMVSRTKERARDPLLVPALPALATPSICWLRSAAASDTLAQHPCSSTAVRATAGSSARASELSNLECRLRPVSRTVAG